MQLLKILFLVLFIAGCSTQQVPVSAPASKPTLEQVVNNKASMTKTLKSLDSNLSVQILKTGMQGSNYVRISALKLSDTPVIAAISQTNSKNKMFKDIIANADVTPIGVKLFAPGSPIKRHKEMKVSDIKISKIDNELIRDYLFSLGYTNDDTIIERYSQFYYQQQTLDLIEYILPAMNKFVRH